MAGDLASQMMIKKEQQLKRTYVRYILAAFVGGIVGGIGIMSMVVQPVYADREAWRLGLGAADHLLEECEDELLLWRRSGSRVECEEARWQLRGCAEENDRLQNSLLRYQLMTGWVYEDDPDQRVLLYGWESLDDSH
jgi:hypothetical protein